MQVAPNQVSPGEAFDVFYFIRNHTDATTYYVRAKIYDVRTGELLDTQTLAQSATNSRLFIKTVTAQPDPTGYGRNIFAIATVYTDSGYTTKSDAYEEQEQYYLIKTVIPFMGSGGGSIDLSQFGAVVERIIDTKLAPLMALEPLEIPPVPYDALFGAIGALQREVNRIPKDMPDSTPLMERIAVIERLVKALPAPEKLDLTPVAGRLEEIRTEIAETLSDLKKLLAQTSDTITGDNATSIKKLMAELYQKLETQLFKQVQTTMKEFVGSQELSIPIASLIRPSKQRETDAPDMSHLM